jgi:oligosaccharide reducing-end xylanase
MPVLKKESQNQHGIDAGETGSYYSGNYRNLLCELLGKSDKEVNVKLEKIWNQLFYGDDRLQRVYYPLEPDMGYIKDISAVDIRSEGMSYGMMISVQMNKKEEFDRIWKWTKTFMQHKSGQRKDLFSWQCHPDGSVIDQNSASDGEEWIVMSLFFASARWGNGKGIYNYQSEANAILESMLNKCDCYEDDTAITNMFHTKEKQVVFSPIGIAATFTDPSYHLPHFYELWARWADKNNQFWYDAASTSRQFFKHATHPVTGLAPDYSHFDGSPYDPYNSKHENFRYDAWRVAMNIALDYSWFARDEWAVTYSNRLLDFFYNQGLDSYGDKYTVGGKKLSKDLSTGLKAMNAVAALAATNQNRIAFVREFWKAHIPKGKYRYYNSLLYILAYLVLSGNFKIYHPTEKPVSK